MLHDAHVNMSARDSDRVASVRRAQFIEIIDASRTARILHHPVERQSTLQGISNAPQEHRAALQTLCLLYGVSSVNRAADFYLSAGALPAGGLQGLRAAMLALCSRLMQDGVLWELCNGFGIPDHCLQAPIAFDWRLL